MEHSYGCAGFNEAGFVVQFVIMTQLEEKLLIDIIFRRFPDLTVLNEATSGEVLQNNPALF